MIRPGLPHPAGERLRARRPRRRRAATLAVAHPPVDTRRPIDPAVQQAREAGGPIDRACYSCQCGYIFVACVSTSVDCPHCKAAQAW
jgi:hypothetical protein